MGHGALRCRAAAALLCVLGCLALASAGGFSDCVAVPFVNNDNLDVERNVRDASMLSWGRSLLQTDVDTALWNAAISGDASAAEAAIDSGANLEVKMGKFPATPLNVAAQEGHIEVVALLLQAGADANAPRDPDGATPVFMASQFGRTEVVVALLNSGADPEIRRTGTDGATPLVIAAGLGRDGAVAALIDGGADVNGSRSSDSATPLFVASQNGYSQAVDALLEAGAGVELGTGTGAKPLMVASQRGHASIVRTLLDAGADPSGKNDRNVTALHLASATLGEQSVAIASTLLDAGADVNARQTDGWTPLVFAARFGNLAVVELLLERGGDPEMEANDGRRAVDMVCGCLHAGGKESLIQCPRGSCDSPDAIVLVAELLA